MTSSIKGVTFLTQERKQIKEMGCSVTGSTTDSDSVSTGSNPVTPAMMGYGVIGSTEDFESSGSGSIPDTPANRIEEDGRI